MNKREIFLVFQGTMIGIVGTLFFVSAFYFPENKTMPKYATFKSIKLKCLPPQIIGGGVDPLKLPCEWRVVK